MKKNNKSRKGFTIVELVIVIAVIAILAGVLIPTFSGVVEKAQLSAEQQKVTNAYKEAYANELIANKGVIKTGDKTDTVNGFSFEFTVDANGAITGVAATESNTTYDYEYSTSTGAWTAKKAG